MANLTEIISFRLAKDIHEKLRREAKQECRSVNGHIQWIVNKYIRGKENEHSKLKKTRKQRNDTS